MKNRKEMKFNDLLKSVILENSRYDILKKTLTEPRKKDDKVIPAKMTPGVRQDCIGRPYNT